MTDHRPGTVALIRVSSDYEPEIAVRGSGKWYVAGPRLGSRHGWHEDHIEIVRPLVALDPEDREQVERLVRAWLASDDDAPTSHGIDAMQAALRSLANPKPAEPTDLAATVKDGDDETWVRNRAGEWINLHSRFGLDPALSWADLCRNYGPIEVTR